MRKLRTIISVILTVGLLAGIVLVNAFAATSRENNLIPVVNGDYLEHYSDGTSDFESDKVGDITSYNRWNGQQGGADGKTLDWYIGGESIDNSYVNQYMNFLHFVNDKEPTNTSTVQPFLKTGEWGSSDESCLDRDFTYSYDYFVFDVDYGTDRYKYYDGEKYVTYTPEALAKAGLTPDSPGVSLAMNDGQSIYPMIRGLKDVSKGYWSKGLVDENGDPILDEKGTQKKDSNGTSWSPKLNVREIDGEFYFEHDITLKKIKLSNAVNEFDHVTLIIRVTKRTEGEITTCSYSCDTFVNGIYLGSNTKGSAQSLSVDFICFALPSSVRNQDAYSVCMDNVSSNYYKIGYTSGDAYGLDDYYKNFNAEDPADLCELSDVVYNYDYVANNYVEIDSVKHYNRAHATELISKLEGKATINSKMTLRDVKLADGLEKLTVYTDRPFTLADHGDRRLIVLEIDGGFIIREATEDDFFKINWYNSERALIGTTEHIFGNAISNNTVYAVSADMEKGVICMHENQLWRIEIAGEEEYLRPILEGEVDPGETVDCYITNAYEEVKVDFYIGNYDEKTGTVIPLPDYTGGFSLYEDAKNLKNCVMNAPDGATLVLCSDINIVGVDNITIGEGKTFSLDLNGHDLFRVGGSVANNAQPKMCFVLNSGVNFNLYSSREGGRIIEGTPVTKKSEATLDGTPTTVITEDITYASGGFVGNRVGAEDITVNVGAFRGYKANLEYSGATLFYGQGRDYSSVTDQSIRNEYVNDKKVVFNLNGGVYYMPGRCAYGLATTTGPDVVFNFENADFYVSHSSYGLIHDYDNGKFTVNTVTTIKNCNILCVNADNVGRPFYSVKNGVATLASSNHVGSIGNYARLYYTIGSKTTVYIEDCNIIGRLYNDIKAGGKLILGKGNVINTSSDLAASGVMAADGVSLAIAPSNDTSLEFTVSVDHPRLYADYEMFLTAPEGSSDWVIKEGIFDGDDVIASVTKYANVITVADELPEGMEESLVKVNWYAPNGEIYKTTYAFKGGAIAKIEVGDFEKIKLNNGWFDIGFDDWINETDGQTADSLIASADKENKFVPKRILVADIEGGKAKLDLFQREFAFYYYFPKPDSKLIEYNHSGDATLGTGWYESHGPADTAKPYTNQTYLKSEGDYYYNYFYIGASTIKNHARSIRFIVKEFDVNGDNKITDDEKNIPLVQNLNISVPRYCELLLDYYAHGSDESNLAYEIIRYMEETALYIQPSNDVSSLSSFYDAYMAKCDCAGVDGEESKACSHVRDLDTLVPDLGGYDVSELSDYLHSVSFGLGVDKPNFEFYLLPIEGKYTLTVKYYRYEMSDGEVVETRGSGTVTAKGTKSVSLPDGSKVDALVYRVTSIRAPYIHRDLQITIKADYDDASKQDVTVTGVYSMAAYINNMPNVRVAKAMYALCCAALDYKLVTEAEKNLMSAESNK